MKLRATSKTSIESIDRDRIDLDLRAARPAEPGGRRAERP
jgi:hypothetical protein